MTNERWKYIVDQVKHAAIRHWISPHDRRRTGNPYNIYIHIYVCVCGWVNCSYHIYVYLYINIILSHFKPASHRRKFEPYTKYYHLSSVIILSLARAYYAHRRSIGDCIASRATADCDRGMFARIQNYIAVYHVN